MRIFENTNYPFVRWRSMGYIVSGSFMLICLISLLTRGVDMGIDFQGGMEFIVETEQNLEASSVRNALAGVLSKEPEIKTFDNDALLIRTTAEGDINQIESTILKQLNTAFPQSKARIISTDVVGPRFADDLKQGAVYSILGSLLVIFVYILIRFEWRFGFGGVACLFHDVTITLGLFSLLQGIVPFSLQIDQTIIAALLTIVGFSINDTVVIFDRIREYSGIFKTESFERIVDRSVNSTLSRTVITSGTVLLVVVVLFIFGGEVLRGFSFALIVGVIAGSYSTIFVAAPIVIELKNLQKKRVR